jgi:hypothetical protein
MKIPSLNSILIVSLVIVVLLFLKQCSDNSKYEQQLVINKQNELALKDSVRTIKTKYGTEISLKNVLIADRKNLMELNSGLAKDLKKLEGNVLYIASTVAEIKSKEPIIINNKVKEYPDGTRELSWAYHKDFDEFNSKTLEGNSKFSIDTTSNKFLIIDKGTTISKDEMKIKLTTGLTELDNSYQIYVTTNYPGVKFDKIDGAILDKNRFLKKVEPTFTFGPTLNVGWGINPLNQTHGPQITIGVGATLNVNKIIKSIFNL